jgi:putative membrane protein
MSVAAEGPDHRAESLRGYVRALSVVVFAAVALLLFAPRPAGMVGAVDVSMLPWVDAALNGVAFLWLAAGYVAVKAGRIAVHRACMTGAMATSALFLVCYVTYHLFSPGPTRYTGDYRAVYLLILVTHVVLAAVILPAAMNTWIRGYTGAIASHRALARPTFFAWVYVSLSGIVVTWMAH